MCYNLTYLLYGIVKGYLVMRQINRLLSLLLAALIFAQIVPIVDNAVTVNAATGLADGTVVYYEDFNYADNSSKASVLSTLGWKTATELNANNTNYAISGGKLLCDSITPGATADSYVTVLDDDYMSEVAKQDYTISYKLNYVEAQNYIRYACLVYNYNGYKSYNTVHVRIAGYGNNQIRTATNWYDHDTGVMEATGTSSLSYKLYGVQAASANASTTTGYPLVNKEITVRIAVDVDAGPTIYLNGVKVSTPATTYNELFLSTKEYATAVALKTTRQVKAYMDDFMVYTGLGDIPANVSKEDVTYKAPIDSDDNALKIMTFNTLFSDQTTDAFSNGINRTYHMSNVVSGMRPDIVGMQERNAKNKSGVTQMLQDSGGYQLVNEYRTDTSVANVVSYVPILFNKARFTLVENAAANNNNAHGALLFDKSYNIKDMTATEIASFAGTKGMAWAVLKDKQTGGYVLALNAHFALNSSSYTGYSDEEAIEARLSNAGQALTKMQEIYSVFGAIPTVFTGDFNMRVYDPAYKLLAETFESSIYGDESFIKYEYSMNKVSAATFTRAPNMPIDHIFYTDESLTPTAYYVGNKAPELMIASDHLPVMATFSYAKVAEPMPSHHTDVYSEAQHVSYKGNGIIYYTTDGTDPRSSATRKLYGSAISVTEDTVLKACTKLNGIYSDVNRITLFFDNPIYITEAIKNTSGTDHTEGFEIYNASSVEIDLSDFALWSYSSAKESTCLSVADADVTLQMQMAYQEGQYVLPAGEIAYCPIVFGDTYLKVDRVAADKTVYLVTMNEDATEVTYHTDRFAAAMAYDGAGTISADRIFPIDSTARSIGYTEDGTLVKRRDYYNATDGSVNTVTNGFNLGNGSYTKLYITIVTHPNVSNAVSVCNMDSTGGGITTTTDSAGTSTTSVNTGAFNFVPGTGNVMTTQGFTANKYTIGYLTDAQKKAIDALKTKETVAGATAITNEAEFLAMAAGGSYYLANDISVNTTYTTVFTGSLDGRGHRVTATVPMFTDMSGTVKNFTVAGNIAVTSGYNSAISQQVTGNARFEDITVNANLSGGGTTGGILGYGKSGCSVVAVRCINNGNHSGTEQVGGLIGYIQGITASIDECINYGTITSTSYSGGIICRFGKNPSTMSYTCNITNCMNYGDVSSTITRAAGVLAYSVGYVTMSGCINYGRIYCSGTYANFVAGGIYGEGSSTYTSGTSTVNTKNSLAISDCYNHGKIEAFCTAGGIVGRTPTVAPASGYLYTIERCGNTGEIVVTDLDGTKTLHGAGGIVGYFYGTTNHRIVRCYNVGKVTATAGTQGTTIRVGGIAAYFNGTKVYFKDCYNAGTITASGTGAVAYQLFYNNHATGCGASYINNNHAMAVSGATYAVNGTQTANYATFSAAELADGTLRDKINSGAGTDIYFQKLDVEAYPVHREYKGFELWSIILSENSDYRENGSFVYRVGLDTVSEDFEGQFITDVKVKNGDAELAMTAQLKTGLKVTSFDGNEEMTVVVLGDNDCDGAITTTDYVCVENHLSTGRGVDEMQFLASDINDDGILSVADCLCMVYMINE